MRFSSRTTVLQVAALVAWAILGPAAAAHATVKNFMAVLNAGQESAAITSNSHGVAFLTFDTKTGELCYSITYTPLDDVEIAAHFHGPASPGESAPALISFPTVGSPKNGCEASVDKDFAKALKQGRIYINIHSALHTAGEIRGQVIPVKGK